MGVLCEMSLCCVRSWACQHCCPEMDLGRIWAGFGHFPCAVQGRRWASSHHSCEGGGSLREPRRKSQRGCDCNEITLQSVAQRSRWWLPLPRGFPASLPCRIQDEPAKWAPDYAPPGLLFLPLLGGWRALHRGLSPATVTGPLMRSVSVNTPKPLHLVLPSFWFLLPTGLTYRRN